MSFCSECGAKLGGNEKFCPECGHKLKEVEVKTSEEVVESAMTGLNKTSMFRSKSHMLFVTPRRLMLVELTAKMLREAADEANRRGKEEGKGFFSRWKDQMGATMDYGSRFIGWTPGQIAAKFPDAQDIGYSSIGRIKFYSKDRGDSSIYEFEIEASGFKEKYQMASMNMDALRRIKQLTGNKFKTNIINI